MPIRTLIDVTSYYIGYVQMLTFNSNNLTVGLILPGTCYQLGVALLYLTYHFLVDDIIKIILFCIQSLDYSQKIF